MTASVFADDPCVTSVNPPGYGYRYVCNSTSTHTIEHVGTGRIHADFYRTRITGRREGEPEIYDVTIDSLSPPQADSGVQAAIADASRFVAGTGPFPPEAGWSVQPTVPLGFSQSFVDSEPADIEFVESRFDQKFSYSSSSIAQTFCVADFGETPSVPVELPRAPCAPGQKAVTLRPLDTSPATELHDALDDSHVHFQFDHYLGLDRAPRLLVTGNLTRTHYEVVASKAFCTSYYGKGLGVLGWLLRCDSRSHHSTPKSSVAAFSGAAWTTRITGQRGEEPPVYDVTLSSTVAPLTDDAVRQALHDARQAVLSAVGRGAHVQGPTTVSSSAQVIEAQLPGGAIVREVVASYPLPLPGGAFCVGDFGDLEGPPSVLPSPPCAYGLEEQIVPYGAFPTSTVHRHFQHDVYDTLVVTGTLTTTHFAYAGERGTPQPVTSVPTVVRPRPRVP